MKTLTKDRNGNHSSKRVGAFWLLGIAGALAPLEAFGLCHVSSDINLAFVSGGVALLGGTLLERQNATSAELPQVEPPPPNPHQ